MNLRNPFVLVTIPLAFAFGLIWFRRKKIHCDTGGKDSKSQSSSSTTAKPNKTLSHCNSDSILGETGEKICRTPIEHSLSVPIESTPTKKNSTSPLSNNNDSFDFKFGKSAPIDITPHKTSPSRMKNSDKKPEDTNTDQKSKDIEYKSLNSIEEHSFDSIDLPGSVNRRFSTATVRSTEPAVVVKANNMVISPQSSFEVSSKTPSPPSHSDDSMKILSDSKKLDVKIENQQNVTSTRSIPVSSPPLSLCSNKSNQSHESGDSGKGSSPANSEGETVDKQLIRDFELGQNYVGYVIGRKGASLREIQCKTGVTLDLRRHPLKNKKFKLITIHGTQQQIDSAITYINTKLPQRIVLQSIDLDIDSADTLKNAAININLLQLNLIDGINNDVIVSTVVNADTLFLQQPLHPSYPNLNILQNIMNQSYNTTIDAPTLPNYNIDTICVGKIDGHWYRLQIIDTLDNECVAKYLDFGGYCRINKIDLRQIRTDFMTIPFQAIETRLADIMPKDGEWNASALHVVVELTQHRMLSAQIVGYSDTGIPEIHLYSILGPNNIVFINGELVARNLAEWSEHPLTEV